MGIGGNMIATVQVKELKGKDVIGCKIYDWVDAVVLNSILDFVGGQNDYSTFDAKVQETTHLFMCDFNAFRTSSGDYVYNPYISIDNVVKESSDTKIDVTSENARMVINGNVYDILMIDNPMKMNQHLEINLKYVGAGLGV